MERFEGEDYQQVVEKMKDNYNADLANYDYSFISYDGFLTIEDKKRDAIFVEVASKNGETIMMAIPYNPASGEGGFTVYRPKILDTSFEDLNSFFEAFFAGIESHVEGAKVWNAYLDQTE